MLENIIQVLERSSTDVIDTFKEELCFLRHERLMELLLCRLILFCIVLLACGVGAEGNEFIPRPLIIRIFPKPFQSFEVDLHIVVELFRQTLHVFDREVYRQTFECHINI